MRASRIILALVVGVQQAVSFAVFAHFMVGNTLHYGLGDWLNEIDLAKAAGIDAFALNIARDEQANVELPQAFEAAVSRGFKLFFSFDYAGNGAWKKIDVINIINRHKGSSAYYKRLTKPLVSTFEGPASGADWHDIKAQTGCFFVPDWSSEGASKAVNVASGVADGLFSWAAWPSGPNDMNTHGDASYMQFLKQGNRPVYMMPISPWFYTNLPGYLKNWLWRGDDLWFDRWVQVLYLTRIQKDFTPPEFAQIISWNDFGESHYIGPIINKATYALDPARGRAPFNYANNISHGGFRAFLPFLIQLAKTGSATVGRTGVQVWYRNSPMSPCGFAETVGNTATQMQLEYSPAVVLSDRIFYSALLASSAAVTVTVGGVSLGATWSDTPAGGAGIYHGSASFAGRTGDVVVTVNGIPAARGVVPIGPAGSCSMNFNPYTVSATGPTSNVVVNINSHVCIAGFGIGNFQNICKFACALGYCPVTACTCSKTGPKPTMPTPLYKDGYPSDGNRNYEGLCAFSVNYRYTGRECSTTKPASYFTPANSPFFPDTSTAGVGIATRYDSMCKFSCKYGWCPINLCRVTATGPINDARPGWGTNPGPLREDLSLDELHLCRFTMLYGYHSIAVCIQPPPPPPPPPVPTTTKAPPPPVPTPTHVFRIYIGSVSDISTSLSALWLTGSENPKCVRGADGSYYDPSPITQPALYNPLNDVSGYQGYVCDGCPTRDHPRDWAVTRIEMWDEPDPGQGSGITTSRVGFITAYKQSDGTYELVSVRKVGDPFTHQGTCTRAQGDPQSFDCTAFLGSQGGHHILTCTSFLQPDLTYF